MHRHVAHALVVAALVGCATVPFTNRSQLVPRRKSTKSVAGSPRSPDAAIFSGSSRSCRARR
jgi:hypothetical protein